ncbi:hypothetical protein OZX56_05480 [Lactobacillus sp. ESL0684]|nr:MULTISPECIES: hypothetical protein [unclassified Lactobacillus]WEV40317.1 hypothetical protein OZX59_09135 [Lactobacillus sp. ESL0681]WEV43000.1 hypothetical protein OZX56_05480 [Lactobacillus sp. ESL0684]
MEIRITGTSEEIEKALHNLKITRERKKYLYSGVDGKKISERTEEY